MWRSQPPYYVGIPSLAFKHVFMHILVDVNISTYTNSCQFLDIGLTDIVERMIIII